MEVPVDAAGNWSFPAPETSGPLTFTAETVNGFSRSGAVSLAVKVTDLDAPVITTPAEGAALTTVTRIDGTGTPGLTVKLTGDITGSALVAADGQWTIPVEEADPGRFTISAVQTSPGKVDSPSVTRTFSVEAPVVAPVEPSFRLSQLCPSSRLCRRAGRARCADGAVLHRSSPLSRQGSLSRRRPPRSP